MASQPTLKCTGPVFVWVRYNIGGTPQFLGTCEQHPTFESEPAWEPVLNDFGGFMTPFDQTYQGATEILTSDLNRWDETQLNIVNSPPNSGGNEGFDAKLSRGSFLIQGGKYISVWFQYSFFGTANAQEDLEPGWFYPACRVGGIFTPKQGTKSQLRRIVFEANNLFVISGGVWSFLLKSNTEADFAPLSGLFPT